MKKTIGIFAIVALFAAPVLISCNGKNNVKIQNENDSINYAFGVANANGLKGYVIKDDTTDTKQMQQFVDGFCTTFGSQKSEERVNTEGLRLGWSISQELKTGYLFRDSNIVAKPEIIIDMFKRTSNGEKWVMDYNQAQQYFMTVMQGTVDSVPTLPTAEQIDTLNMIMGYINATMARQYMLGPDTTAKHIKKFVAGFEKGLTLDSTKTMLMEGMRVGAGMYSNVKNDPDNFLGFKDVKLISEAVCKGLSDALLNADKALMSPTEANEYLDGINQREIERRAEEKKLENADVIEAGEKYLEENGKREGVITTESGLQYEVLVEGNGPKPAATDKVKVHYHGTTIDGTVFDSSVERGEPTSFPLNQVIKGWTEGVQLMPVGSKYRFVIPYDLAYGERGAGESIKPFSTLIFEVELLSIEK